MKGAPTPDPSELRRSGELFSAVLQGPDHIVLMTDHLRSWPIYYAVHEGSVHIGDDAFTVADAAGGRRVNPSTAHEFLHTGFVTGSETLLTGVAQVPSGSTVRINRGSGAITHELERPLRLRPPVDQTLNEFTDRFGSKLDAAMERLRHRAGDRLVLLPLSAGLDSRLLAALLVRHRFPRVLTFTYGLPGITEAESSRRIAEDLGLPWVKVEYTGEELRSAWQHPSTAAFLQEASGGASLPHVQDWYAIRHLTSNGLVPRGSIVIPGHTIVSAAKDVLLRTKPVVSREDIVRSFRPWHFDLRSQAAHAQSLPHTVKTLREYFEEVELDGSRRATMNAVRWYWQRERNAKYIINSMRTYEHFGLDWALPMHDLHLWAVYESAPDAAIESREWYRAMTESLYSEQSGKPSPTAPAPQSKRSRARRAAHTVAIRTRLPQLYVRLRRISAVIDHPLGFDSLVTGASRRDIALGTLRGTNLLGMYAELFLSDEWVPGSTLFRSR